MLSSVVATATTATAAGTSKSQERPSSTWTQPGTAALDGLGAFLYPMAPTPGPAQGSPLGYEYTLTYRFQDGSGGLVVLGYQNGRKVAGFGLIPTTPVATVPFDWQFGRVYFLFTFRVNASQWGGWVFDYSANAFTLIAVLTPPAGAGGIAPTLATTTVDYGSTLAPSAADQTTCGFYPQVDAYFTPTIGWRGTTATVATLAGNAVEVGDCPSSTSTDYGWQHYHLGSPAAA